MQFIDVRDLAAWTLQATQRRLSGPYICTGPEPDLTTEILLRTCSEVSGSDAKFTWVGDHFLDEQGLTKEVEKPWWVPKAFLGYATFDTSKALAEGLAFRPLEATVRDTLNWHQTRHEDHSWNSGLSLQQEQRLLSYWHHRAREPSLI